jgi:branched-chain amino acid transport system substrate-binding protein
MYSFVWGGGEPDFEVAGPAAEGYYNLQFTAHPTDNPQAYQLLRDYWKKMGKTEDTKLTGSVFYARGVFNAALIMEGIKNSADKDKLTGEDVKKGMETLADFKVYGLSPGVTLSSSDHGGTRKLRLMQFKNGKNSLVKDWFEGPKPA